MSTPSICEWRCALAAAVVPRRRWRAMGALAAMSLVFPGGCTYTGGELLYNLGLAPGQKAEARFTLTAEPILILVDDPGSRVDWPAARRYFFDELAQQLLRNEAAQKIVPLETIENLRQSLPDFEKRGAREIGEAADASQVLWIEVQEFLASEDIEDATMAAYFGVTVKVLNVEETERPSRVRLWPDSPRGHQVSVSMSGSEVSMIERRDAIAKELAKRLADRVAKLFYKHRLDDFEQAP